MVQRNINLGSGPGANDGDILYDAFEGIQNNFGDNYRDTAMLIARANGNTPDVTFNMVAADNSRIAIIAEVTGVTYASWQIKRDDPSTPAVGDVNWVSGLVASTIDLLDWILHRYYLWLKQADGTVLPVEPVRWLSDGAAVPGLEFLAKDTEGPVWGATSLVISPAGDFTITPPIDAGSGLAVTGKYDIFVDDSLAKNAFDALAGNVVLTPRADPYLVQAVCRDAIGNTSITNGTFVTVGATSGGTIGFKTASSVVDEAIGTYNLPLVRIDGTVASSVKVSTWDGEAKANVNFTALVNVPVDFTVDGEVTVPIPITNVSSPLNLDFYVTVDYGSGNASNASIGIERHYIKLNGVGGTGTSGHQGRDVAPWDVTVECKGPNVTFVPGALAPQDQWVEAADIYNRTSLSIYATPSSTHYGSSSLPTKLDITGPYIRAMLDLKGGGADFVFFLRGHRRSSAGAAQQVHPVLLRNIASIGVDNSGTGAVLVMTENPHGYVDGDKIFFEGTTAHDSPLTAPPNAYTISGAVGSQFEIPNMALAAQGPGGRCFGEDSLLGLNFPVAAGNNEYGWDNKNIDGVARTALVPVAGVYEARLYMQDGSYYMRPDRFTFGQGITFADVNVADAGSRGLNTDDHFGKMASAFAPGGGGTPADSTELDPFVPYPLPAATVTVADADKFPSNGTPGITARTTVRMDLPGMLGLELNYFRLIGPNGGAVASTLVVTANSVELTPNNALPSPATYVVEGAGRAVGADGAMRSILLGTWTFTTLNTGTVPGDPGDALFYLDFEGIRP